jgi:hypothetical protein
MGGRFRLAALVVAGAGVFAACAEADDLLVARPARGDATIFETSARVRFVATELAFRGDRPKAWDEIVSPEFRASLRVLAGLFEGKLEIGVLSDRFQHFQTIDVDQLRGEAQLGLNTGAWSFLVEWKARNVFQPGFDEFMAGQNAYALRVRDRFAVHLFADLPSALCQASVAGGYAAATPRLMARDFAELEFEMVQPFGNGFALMVSPKLELADYLAFPGEREDAIVSVKVVPSYRFEGGVTLSLEGQATIAFSTLDRKTGEIWELTPLLRLQKAL